MNEQPEALRLAEHLETKKICEEQNMTREELDVVMARLSFLEARVAAIESWCLRPLEAPAWRNCNCPPDRTTTCFNTACPRIPKVTFTTSTTGTEQPR